MERLNKEFFNRNPEIVAKELLGKIIVRKIGNKILKSRVVETEAYFDRKDPASRACKNGDICNTMKMEAGTILIFNVHNNWLLNFVTGKKCRAEAVLIRAVEPLNFNGKCNGPGLLTKALFIDKRFHKHNIINNKENFAKWQNSQESPLKIHLKNDKKMNYSKISKEIFLIDDGFNNFDVDSGFRIGVREDLKKPLRFYIKGNKSVSKK